MIEYFIFSDASFDPQSAIGVSATLILTNQSFIKDFKIVDLEILTRRIDRENIARLEFLAVISALIEWKEKYQTTTTNAKITLVVDCMAIKNLLHRRERLEKNKFMSLRKSQVLANADLYQKFLDLYDELRPDIIWIKGHSPKTSQSKLQQVFSMVDKVARKKLRELCK